MYPPLDVEFYGQPNPIIQQLIVQQKYSGLRSIVLSHTGSDFAQSIFNGEYPNLRICYFGSCQQICLPSEVNIKLQALRHLTVGVMIQFVK